MTDIRDSAVVREALITTTPALTGAGLVREVLLVSATTALNAGVVREVLLADAVVGAAVEYQYAVSVIT